MMAVMSEISNAMWHDWRLEMGGGGLQCALVKTRLCWSSLWASPSHSRMGPVHDAAYHSSESMPSPVPLEPRSHAGTSAYSFSGNVREVCGSDFTDRQCLYVLKCFMSASLVRRFTL